jgi:hypothetical protein
MKAAVFAICKLYTWFIAGYCLIPFVYLGFGKWWAIYKKLYLLGHIVILPMPFLWRPLVLKAAKLYFPLEKKSEADAVEEKATPNIQKKDN